MTDLMFVAHDGTSYRCYVTPDGIRKRFIGCRHDKPRQAIAHTVPVYVSPSRSALTDRPIPGRLDSVRADRGDEPPAGAQPAVSPVVILPATGDL